MLVENRPKDPLSFLSQYFGGLVEEVNARSFINMIKWVETRFEPKA